MSSGKITRSTGTNRPKNFVIQPEAQSLYLAQRAKKRQEKDKERKGTGPSKPKVSKSEKKDDPAPGIARSQSSPSLTESSTYSFETTIDTPILCGGLLLFLRSSYCEEVLLCLKQIYRFKKLYPNLSPQERQQ
jgi:hypothetical protein